MPVTRRFECTHCAVCCKSFKVVEKKISKDASGIFYTVDQRSRVLSLWRWEADRLRKRADKLGIHSRIRPLSYIVDSKNSKAIIIVWYLDSDVCPFLNDDRCSIWEQRPFSCKQFPLYGDRSGMGISSICPDVVRPPLTGNDVANGAAIMSAYPDEVPFLYKDMEIYKMIFGFIRDLQENEVIEWQRDAEITTGRDLIEDTGTRVDLFDLVVDEGILERKNMDQVFQQLDTIDEVKDRLEIRITKDMVGI
jgi:Fe-S-cluster containining protein